MHCTPYSHASEVIFKTYCSVEHSAEGAERCTDAKASGMAACKFSAGVDLQQAAIRLLRAGIRAQAGRVSARHTEQQ